MELNEYLLFIDTETSDKPRKWRASTENTDKWPYILQVSWTIYRKTGEHVLTRDFYINPGEIEIHEDALQIHGITLEFLQKNGRKRATVLEFLSDDLKQYKPLIIGHFVSFDLKMLEVGFNRVKIPNNFTSLPKFCTMMNTSKPMSHERMLRLNELYQSLFNKEFDNPHNAKMDAIATKDCFFELLKRGEIDAKVIKRQQKYFRTRRSLKSILLTFIP